MTRIYVDCALAPGARLELPDAAARHVAQVLRMRSGEALTLFNGDGSEYAAAIETAERRSVTVQIGAQAPVERESRLAVTLAQCVSKGERMDYTIQKAVELGAAGILPLLSARSVVKLDGERWEKKQEHWRGVVAAACEQSGRNRLPPVAPVQKFDAFLPTSTAGLRLVLAPTAAVSLKTLPAAAAVTLLVGPEGGLSDDEIARALRAGYTGITLGPRILRTETAGVAALAALQALWGDLG
ncbi:MAG: 16S rRNA (uracil(1498)-N(3))-methyltransferase [Nevskia sp.]